MVSSRGTSGSRKRKVAVSMDKLKQVNCPVYIETSMNTIDSNGK